MNVEVFYHMYCVEDCVDRFLSSYNKMEKSGLLDTTNNVHVVMVGEDCKKYGKQIKSLTKVTPYVCPNIFGEMNTIKFLYDFCQQHSNKQILYFHSKGASKNKNPNIKAWVEYMEYFLIENYSICLEALNTFDTVGVDYLPAPMPHYSGNFWWANGIYIKNHSCFDEGLKTSIINDPRWYCEFWLLHDNNVKHKCLHNSNIDLYGTEYTKEKYAIR